MRNECNFFASKMDNLSWQLRLFIIKREKERGKYIILYTNMELEWFQLHVVIVYMGPIYTLKQLELLIA